MTLLQAFTLTEFRALDPKQQASLLAVVPAEGTLSCLQCGLGLLRLAAGYRFKHECVNCMLCAYPCSTYFRSTWESLQAGLLRQVPGLLPPAAATFDMFMWAVACVRARAHAPLGESASLALVPVADMVSDWTTHHHVCRAL